MASVMARPFYYYLASFLWISLLWTYYYTFAMGQSINTTPGTTKGTTQSDYSSIDLSTTKLNVKSITPKSILVKWSFPEHYEEKCRLVIQEERRTSDDSKSMTIIYDLSSDERNVTFEGLQPRTLYRVSLECHGSNQHQITRVKRVWTLNGVVSPSRTSPSINKHNKDRETDDFEPKIEPVKKRPGNSTNRKEGKSSVFGNLSKSDNQTDDIISHNDQSDQSTTKRLVWLIPSIAGSVAGLIIIVAVTVACSRAMVKQRNSGKFIVRTNRNESGKKLITITETNKESDGQEGDKKDNDSQKKMQFEDDTKHSTEMNSVNTLQIRQASNFPPNNRAAQSGISWGSEFDVLDRPEAIYNNDAMSPPPQYAATFIPEPSKQIPPAVFRQQSVPPSAGSVRGAHWTRASPTQATMQPSYDQSVYAETNINQVVPVKSRMAQGSGVYSNLQTAESLYVNTSPLADERPPAIPPRPR